MQCRVPDVSQSKLPVFIVCSIVAMTACFAAGSSGHAQTYNMPYRSALAYYGAGNYSLAFVHFNQLLAQNPNDARTHYYAGNCLVKLGRVKEAKEHYRTCLLLGTDNEATVLSSQALAVWDKLPGLTAPLASAPAPAPAAAPVDRAPPKSIDTQTDERARMISDHTALQIKNLTEQFKRWSKVDSDKLTADIRSVPKHLDVNGTNVPNPDYDSIVKSLKQDAQKKAADMQVEYNRRLKEITDDGNKRQQIIVAEGANVKSMYARDSGFSRMMPHGSNLYVRNYLNQSGMDETPELVQSQRMPLPEAMSAVAHPLRFNKSGPGRLLPPLR